MADKLNDDEIAEELKRFGEAVKLPIDKKKRPILIKKLNHLYARENPPPKRSRSAGRQSKVKPAPLEEFSDDSQDESETSSLRSSSRVSNSRNRSQNNLNLNDSQVQYTRDRSTDNGMSSARSQSRSRGKRAAPKSTEMSRRSNMSQIEVYPDEFSDNDTMDESVYEVEEQSIGVNTSMNFDDTFDDQELNPGFSLPIKRKIRSKTSSVSPARTHTKARKQGADKLDLETSNDHYISKSILMVMAIFFAVLGLGYLYIKRDIFLTSEAALTTGSDLKRLKDGEAKNEDVNKALRVLQGVSRELAKRKGKFELGDIDEKEKGMYRQEVEAMVRKVGGNEEEEKLVLLCFELILSHPEWDILAFNEDGTDASDANEVYSLESRYGDLSFITRAYLALLRVLYGLLLLLFCIGLCICGIFYLRWQNKKKEREELKVYELVEKIIELLKDNSELAETKNDPDTYPPYLAVQHVRDQLIPIAKRKGLKQLWDDAVSFIETNESRIRVDTQIIQGEEFTVWRWLPAVPNGHKMWQGQAFGETNQSNVNALPYGPTPCLKVRNMFDANMEKNSDDWHLDIEEGVLAKCKDVKGILHIFVDRNSREGCVYIKCDSCQKAFEVYQALHGWWFDGRLVTVKYLRLEHYHDRFPDSRNRKYPLKPSSAEMPSVSRPYHRSALEMT